MSPNAAQLRADEAFARLCGAAGADGSCGTMPAVLDRYASFHRRAFAPEASCSERRVLIVRESFSDQVGIGHVHLSFQRFTALALAMGRALVFSACEAPDDRWRVRGRQIFKDAKPFDCATPHMSFAELYEGWAGIDLRWTPQRRELLRGCGFDETTLNLNSPELPVLNWTAMPCVWGNACRRDQNPDLRMSCARYASAHCPAIWDVFGPNQRGGRIAAAPVLALYNPRRDGGGQASTGDGECDREGGS